MEKYANNNEKKTRPNNQSMFDVNRYFETISKLFKQKHNNDFSFHVTQKFNKGKTAELCTFETNEMCLHSLFLFDGLIFGNFYKPTELTKATQVTCVIREWPTLISNKHTTKKCR